MPTIPNTNIVAAIVIGSSKITGIVGTKEIDGSIRVKAHVAQNSSDFIGKGRVLNVEKMTTCLQSIKARLEEQSSFRIKYCYVAIGCLGMRSTVNTVDSNLSTSELVTEELLTSIAVRNKESIGTDRYLLKSISLGYDTGTTIEDILDPKGAITSRISAKFLNIICSQHIFNTLYNCFRKANIALAGNCFHIAAEHLASVITVEQERTSGCAIIDLGSETTTISIYSRKLLRHLVVIPLGSNSITRDIENVFNVEHDEAEHLKMSFGYPTPEQLEDKEEFALRDGGRTKKKSELANIIDARVEEIVQNIRHQIEIAPIKKGTLVNGLYICGGGAQLKNILSAFQRIFPGVNARTIKGTSRITVFCSDQKFNESGIFNTALGLVNNADINCYGGEYKGLFTDDAEAGIEEIPEVPAEEEPISAEEKARKDAAEARAKANGGLTPELPKEKHQEEHVEEEEETTTTKKPKKSGRASSIWGKISNNLKKLVSEDVD